MQTAFDFHGATVWTMDSERWIIISSIDVVYVQKELINSAKNGPILADVYFVVNNIVKRNKI